MTETHADIIALWPSTNALAEDLSAEGDAVRKWKARRSIPAEYWTAVVRSAKRRGIRGVTLKRLAVLCAASKQAERPLSAAAPIVDGAQ